MINREEITYTKFVDKYLTIFSVEKQETEDITDWHSNYFQSRLNVFNFSEEATQSNIEDEYKSTFDYGPKRVVGDFGLYAPYDEF